MSDEGRNLNSNNAPLEIGIWARESYDTSTFNGRIDDVHIYNRALSELEIQQLYQGENSCTTNGGFTQVDINNAIEQGKQACINNPASCGISISGNSTPAAGDCMANYSTSGRLHVPCVSVPDAFGGITVYDIKLDQQTGSFDLDMGSIKPK